MTGIYSQPIEHPGQPENAMRARAGLRPLCFNRPDFPERVQVLGKPMAFLASDGTLLCAPNVEFVDNAMSTDCKAWAVHPQEDPATESIPGRECWRCWGCRHLPEEPRVIACAAASELP
jgi:hypothetical protein